MSAESQSEIKSKTLRSKTKKFVKKAFSMNLVRRRLPITNWLPKYRAEYITQDVVAGITVGLTAIPQGIAYAVIAGLAPEYGLYASLTSGVIYMFFGSCYNVTVGPTAILATLVAKCVSNYSVDFAILTTFLSGMLMFVMGIFNLGFLVDFISMPVIRGFTIAAALQIIAGQLKPFFGLKGSSGHCFGESMQNLFANIRTIQLWETVLGAGTVISLMLLQKMGQGCKQTDGFVKQTRWFVSLLRNAIVVIIGMIIAYILKVTTDTEPLALIGDIGSGFPKFSWPPFSTRVGEEVYGFRDMLSALGAQSLMVPFVAILETVAVAKAFAAGGRIDATQELIAVGLCNIIGSFGQSMPITGSFTRTALNHDSGVKTPAGGVIKVLLIIVSLTCFTSILYYIPRASLAGLIITAMFSIIDYRILPKLWKSSRREFFLLAGTIMGCLSTGLEFGILVGILQEALVILYNVARPKIEINKMKCDKGDLNVVSLCENVTYCAVDHLRQRVIKASSDEVPIVIDGGNLKMLDFTAAFNLMAIVKDMDTTHQIVLFNFKDDLKKMCLGIDSQYANKFVYADTFNEITNVFTNDV